MTPLVLEPQLTFELQQLPLGPEGSPEGRAAEAELAGESATGSADVGGEPTLDAVLSRMWEGLVVHRSVDCPLCGGEVRPVYGAHPLPTGGRCGVCATTLS